MEPRELAQNLRRRLNDHTVDIELMAREALDVFAAAGSPARVRWLTLELDGYGTAVHRARLPEVLGVPDGDRLAVHVPAYRAQNGRIVEAGELTGRSFQHFFVESLHELSAAAQQVRQGASGELRLDFGPDIPNHPATLVFPADTFDRIMLGFRAVLHLELGSLAT